MRFLSLFPLACDRTASVAEFLFDRFIRQPFQGVVEVFESLALVVPDLTEATMAATVQAISAQLSFTGQLRVSAGLARLSQGLRRLVWPAGVAAAVLVCQLPGGFWVLAVAGMLLLTT